MRDLGHDPEPLLRRYHLSEQLLANDNALVPLRAGTHLLEASAELTGCGDFGLRLSGYQRIDVLGPLSVVLRNASTVRDAMNDVARYLCVHSPGIVVTVDERNPILKDTVEVSVDLRLSGHVTKRQNVDLCLADAHNFIRLFVGGEYDLRAVSIPHEPVVSRRVYERFFGAHLLAEPATRASLHLGRETLAVKVSGSNAALRRMAEDYIARHFGDLQGSMSERVREVLRQTLGASSCDKSSVAAVLALHPRTMQRHLAEEHTCFELLRGEVRRQLAQHYLCDTRLPMRQIALMLGFPDQSALSRACRLWFARTPSHLRAGALMLGAAAVSDAPIGR